MCRLKLLYSNIFAVAGVYSIVRELKQIQINFGNECIGRMVRRIANFKYACGSKLSGRKIFEISNVFSD